MGADHYGVKTLEQDLEEFEAFLESLPLAHSGAVEPLREAFRSALLREGPTWRRPDTDCKYTPKQ